MLTHFVALFVTAAAMPQCDYVQVDVSTAGISARFGKPGSDTVAAPHPKPKPVQPDSEIAFIGQLASVVDQTVPSNYSPPNIMTFVMEKIWKGRIADTLSAIETPPGTSYFLPGRTYFIKGRIRNGVAEADLCAGSRDLKFSGGKDTPGTPLWVARAPGLRPYDRADSAVSISGGAEVEIAIDGVAPVTTMSISPSGPKSELVAGSARMMIFRFHGLQANTIYRLRAHYPDGGFEDFYAYTKCQASGFCLTSLNVYRGSSLTGVRH